jgi:hypothetical protein
MYGQSRLFEVSVPAPDTHTLTIQWYLDDAPVASGGSYRFTPGRIPAGHHAVRVVVRDPIAKVRNDAANVLVGARTWRVMTSAATARIVPIKVNVEGLWRHVATDSGNIAVAIIATDEVDAAAIDPASVRFGPHAAKARRGHSRLVDVDGDGKKDLLLSFRVHDTGIRCDDRSVSLHGRTFAGAQFKGSQAVMSKCGHAPREHGGPGMRRIEVVRDEQRLADDAPVISGSRGSRAATPRSDAR